MTNLIFAIWTAFSVPTETNWTCSVTNMTISAHPEDFGNFVPWWVTDMSDIRLQRIPRATIGFEKPVEPARYSHQ